MKSLTQSSGSQTPLFSPFGWWSQVLFCRCFFLDPWSSLSREGEGCLGGLLTARAPSGPLAEAEEQEGQGAGGSGWEYQRFQWPGSLYAALKGLKALGLTRPGPLPPFRPFPLRSPSSGLHILCLGSSPHTSLI